MVREIYLDNCATTRVLPEVAQRINGLLIRDFGNPSSLHGKGMEAERILQGARRIIAGVCAVKEREVFFTSGGTEANNLAIKGAARSRARRGKHLITAKTEHPSVLYTFRALEKEGFKVTYLDVDSCGRVTPDQVAQSLTPETTLISIMHVNNEVGTIQPVERIGQVVRQSRKDIYFHVDAVQSFGKLPVTPAQWQAQLVSMSAHKIHGPKGVGALVCLEGTNLEPLLHGGGQEEGVRPGTENMSGIAGFAEAVRLSWEQKDEHLLIMTQLREQLLAKITDRVPGLINNGAPDGVPYIISITIPGIKGEVLVHTLEEQGIYISTGSACHSHRSDPSHVLLAMGREAREIESSLRISFSPYNNRDEVDWAAVKLAEAVRELRLFASQKS